MIFLLEIITVGFPQMDRFSGCKFCGIANGPYKLCHVPYFKNQKHLDPPVWQLHLAGENHGDLRA